MPKGDIRLCLNFATSTKTMMLESLLGADGVWSLVKLWLHAGAHRKDGRLTKMNEKTVAMAAGWRGDADLFVSTLLEVGFLDRDSDGTLALHDWAFHQPFVTKAPERTAQAKTAAVARWSPLRGAALVDDTQDADSIAPSNAKGNAPITYNLEPKTKENSAKSDDVRTSSPPGFDVFWAAVPSRLKVGKKKAQAEWKNARLGTADGPRLAEAMRRQLAYKAAMDARGAFCAEIQHPERWIKNARYEDEVPELTGNVVPFAATDPFGAWKAGALKGRLKKQTDRDFLRQLVAALRNQGKPVDTNQLLAIWGEAEGNDPAKLEASLQALYEMTAGKEATNG